MSESLESRYNHKEEEAKTYERWEKSGYFNPDNCIKDGVADQAKEPYSIVLPPPNVTGILHMGHAAMLAIEDILIRYARMQGRPTLWVPGTDHAAIATQSKVETMIQKKEGKNRHDLGREEFLRRVNEFAKDSHDTIVKQVRSMGASLDWSREAYTLDEKRNLAVRTAFKKMYDAGLIYRGDRLVNWDPKLQTTVSDDEIEWEEEKIPFYYLKYGPFVIGTSRPETKFGDKYVVMHPDDERYKQYKNGEKIELEWINGPITATIIKDEIIDMSFGTGVMTITPWHDAADFEIAERHDLDKEQIIDLKGKLLPIAGEFAGMHIKKARQAIIEKLEKKGLLEKVEENYLHRVATSQRSGEPIEPQIMRQWFVDVNKKFLPENSEISGIPQDREISLKELMRHVVEEKIIQIVPDRFEKIYFNWIDNLRDWCISRQIWFGHRIPVWYCLNCKNIRVDANVKSRWFFVRHGETDWNKEGRLQGGNADTPLNDTGREQAHETAEKLKAHHIDLIVSSDLARARETAEIISKATGAEIILEPALRERHAGAAVGMTLEERKKKWPSFDGYHDYNHGYAEGDESYAELEKRAWTAISKHFSEHSHKNVVIVSHGAVMRTLMRKLRNLTYEEAMSRETVKNAEALQIDILYNCEKCGEHFFEQDPDTLDTWFSSGLWTFSTLGWPEQTHDLEYFHPTSVLETGYDILFFWIARMILMTGFLLGDIPFHKVYLHGLVRDEKGKKMSKSLGNAIDPLEMSEKYGADATRLSLIIGAAPGNDVKLSEDRIRGYRNFTTKIWNAARFVLMNKPEGESFESTAEDEGILSQLAELKKEITAHIESFEFHLAGEKLYHYFWHTFADEIIESMKPRLKNPETASGAYATLEKILLESLKMLHPFMPFVTEELWSKFRPGKLLMVERW